MNRKIFSALKNVCQNTWTQMQQAQLFMVASSLAYTTILSIVPALAVSFAIFQAFGGLQKLYGTIEPFILSNLAHGASQEAITALHGFINNVHAGAIGAGGLIALIFTSMSLLSSAENAINRVWQVRNDRSFLSRFSTYWLFITLGPLGLSVAVGVATSLNFPLSRLFPNGTGMFLLTVALFFGVYKWVPHIRVKWQCALISATLTSTLWSLARVGYTIYTTHVVTYNTIYGSLGAVPILLIWIYISWLITLGGVALTVALQKH